MVTEIVSSSNDLENLVNVPVNNEFTSEIAKDDIVQAAGDVGSAVDKVVCAAKGVPAIDDAGRAADGFWRAVDEEALSVEVMPKNYDDAPVLDSVDPPTEDRSQKSDDEDLE